MIIRCIITFFMYKTVLFLIGKCKSVGVTNNFAQRLDNSSSKLTEKQQNKTLAAVGCWQKIGRTAAFQAYYANLAASCEPAISCKVNSPQPENGGGRVGPSLFPAYGLVRLEQRGKMEGGSKYFDLGPVPER